jgi:hypothetical protein
MLLGKGLTSSVAVAAVLICGSSIWSALPQEQTVNMMDGTVWPHLTEKERLVVVRGYIDGRRTGFFLGKAAALRALADVPGVKGIRTTNAAKKWRPI